MHFHIATSLNKSNARHKCYVFRTNKFFRISHFSRDGKGRDQPQRDTIDHFVFLFRQAMTKLSKDPFDDAELLFGRAQQHIVEFRQKSSSTWTLTKRRDGDRENPYSLKLSRPTLRLLKPIASDVAVNLIHSLDNIASACARSNGILTRNKKLYYPLCVDDIRFNKKMHGVRQQIGDDCSIAICAVRDQYRASFRFLAILKEMADTSKHWQLIPADADARAVVALTGKSRYFVEIPPNYFQGSDEFKFSLPDNNAKNTSFQILMASRIRGLWKGEDVDPIAVFSIASSFVRATIDAVRQATGKQ